VECHPLNVPVSSWPWEGVWHVQYYLLSQFACTENPIRFAHWTPRRLSDMVTYHTWRKLGCVVVKATTLALVALSIHLRWAVLFLTCLFLLNSEIWRNLLVQWKMKQTSWVLPSQNTAQILGLSVKYQSGVCGLEKYSGATLNSPAFKIIRTALKQINTHTIFFIIMCNFLDICVHTVKTRHSVTFRIFDDSWPCTDDSLWDTKQRGAYTNM